MEPSATEEPTWLFTLASTSVAPSIIMLAGLNLIGFLILGSVGNRLSMLIFVPPVLAADDPDHRPKGSQQDE